MAESLPWIAASIGLGTGAIVGSFLATVVMRAAGPRSVLRGRSACDACGETLGPAELVPLASFAWRRGRCRFCGARIDRMHPAIELLAALIGGAALASRPDLAGAAGAGFGWALLLLAALDLRHFWLPDRVTLPLIVVGLAAATVALPGIESRAIGAVVGYAALEGLRLLYARVRGRAGLGGGDPKLLAAIGAWLGWAALPGVVLGASLSGLAVAALLTAAGRRIDGATRLPFGALLAPAAFLVWLVQAAG